MSIRTAERLNSINEYYFSQKLKQLRKFQEEGRDIINLGIGNPDIGPPDSIIDKARESLSLSSSHGYQPYKSIFGLRSAFSDWYRRFFKVELDPDNEILPLLGSKEGIMHLSLAFLNRADGVLVPDPGYPAYEAAAKICGARVVYYNLKEENGWVPDLNALNLLDLSGIKLMWINYPNMPTGSRASKEVLKRIIEFGRENNILIVNDNPYSLILNSDPVSLLSVDTDMQNSMELNSLSKSYNMAGWRVGMLGGSAPNIEAVLKVKSNIDSGMFLPIQMAAIEALNTGSEWTDSINSHYRRRRDIVYKILDNLGSRYERDQSGLFIWSELPDGHSSSIDFSEYLLDEYNIFITPGAVFGSNGRKYLRTSLCVSEERLEECFRRIDNSKK